MIIAGRAHSLQRLRDGSAAVDRCSSEQSVCGGIAGPLTREARFRRTQKSIGMTPQGHRRGGAQACRDHARDVVDGAFYCDDGAARAADVTARAAAKDRKLLGAYA
jgi:hypothetical protein